MSRRKRCPYCDSLKTVEALSYTRTADGGVGDISFIGWVCDDCDAGWETDAERRAIKAERKQATP